MASVDPADWELVARFRGRANDLPATEAFDLVYRRYWAMVYRTCFRQLQERTAAEDAAQRVFIHLSQRPPALREGVTLSSWLFQTAVWVSQNAHRAENRRRRREELSAVRQTSNPEPDSGLRTVVDEEIRRLRDADREAILLRFEQDLEFGEVAKLLGITENGARMRVQRALEKLRVRLGRLGVAMSVVMLTTLLRRAEADDVPPCPRFDPSRKASPSLPWCLTPAKGMVGWSTVVSVTLVGAAVVVGWLGSRPSLPGSPLVGSAQTQFFRALQGQWLGELEYADDQTGVHHTYPTRVTTRWANGKWLWDASYVGSDRVDQTILRPLDGDRVEISNGGADASHQLVGVGHLRRMPNGTVWLIGSFAMPVGEGKVELTPSPNQLTWQESVKPVGESAFRFRNRYTLRAAGR